MQGIGISSWCRISFSKVITAKSNFDDPRERFVVRACKLPWSATAESVAKIFSDCNIRGGAKNGIHFTYSSEGHPSGECFVELVSREDMEKALAKSKSKRFVQVLKSTAGEMEQTCKRMGQPQDRGNEAVVRLRGLPFQVSKEEIAQFFTEFKGLEIVPNGITITLDEDGRTTGDAFVEFASPELASQAMKKNEEFIRRRKIKIFKSAKADIKYVSKPKLKPLMSTRPGPYDRSPGGFGGGRGRFGGVVAGDGRRFRGQGGPVFGRGYGGDCNGYGGGRGSSRDGRGGRGHSYIELFLCSEPGIEDVSGRGWAGPESGGENFGSENSGGDNFSENFEGNFNVEDNSNFGCAGSSFGGNQTNIGGFGGQVNQSSGFSSPQPQQQQQQSNFSNQMGVGGGGGSFGNQSNSVMQEHSIPAHRRWWEFWKSRQCSNAGAFNTGPSPGGGNYSAQSSSGQTNGLSGFGGQMPSCLSNGMTTGNYKDAITVSTPVQPVVNVLCTIM
ncbi:heterogeneous nuclear ribonucleoprotein H-like isoform X6 [Acropora muricata]|uniref:heterogeneous nuclear ribonucleoprotein H-like isoform X6 n=1 Tax=Acropora muricata TaxID=159855 RepID=UPI0034E53D2F